MSRHNDQSAKVQSRRKEGNFRGLRVRPERTTLPGSVFMPDVSLQTNLELWPDCVSDLFSIKTLKSRSGHQLFVLIGQIVPASIHLTGWHQIECQPSIPSRPQG